MRDPNYVFPEDAVPGWAQRYLERRADRHERYTAMTRTWLSSLRNRRGRRLLAALVAIFADLMLIASAASFWSLKWAVAPFVVGLVVSLVAVMMLRVATGFVAAAPAAALDEIQLAQRNAARSICYALVLPLMLVVYAVLITLSWRDSASGRTLVSTAWLLISSVYIVSCLPDVLMSWWMHDPDPDDDLDSTPAPTIESENHL